MIGAIFMTYNFLSQTNSSEFNLYEYVDDESLMIEATMGARMEYITIHIPIFLLRILSLFVVF